MRSYTLMKHTKICSYCGNDFVSKLGETVCGSCTTAENLEEMKDQMAKEKVGPWSNRGNGALEMNKD